MKVEELYSKVNNGTIKSDIDLQREIVYNSEKQSLVIDSLDNGIPLPAFYLWKNDKGFLEVLDGKQRIEAIKKFFQNDLTYQDQIWKQFGDEFQNKINDVELSVIECGGTEQLKREIFRRINTLGVPLSPYEVLNGLYHGEYLEGLTDFVGQDKFTVSILGANSRGRNQIILLKWIIFLKVVKVIEEYVKTNQNNPFEEDQKLISQYIRFIKDIFTDKSKIKLDLMFRLSAKYLSEKTRWKENRDMIIKDCNDYIKSDDFKISNTNDEDIEAIILGITGDFRVDKKRFFSKEDKEKLLQTNKSKDGLYECAKCNQHFYEDELTIDHKTAWSKGGRTVLSNAQLLCRACNSWKYNN
jgi:5-methylcytosine-specific restriction endonuclease McrA